MSDSIAIQKAKSLIASVRNVPQPTESHISKTIELAAILLKEAKRIQTKSEKKQQAELAGMMNDPIGKAFTSTITDQCFRSKKNSRSVNQLDYVIHKYGVPSYLSFDKRLGLKILGLAGRLFPKLAVSFTIQAIRKETESVILPGETLDLVEHLKKRHQEGVKVNLNHLGEAILGENEARNYVARSGAYSARCGRPAHDSGRCSTASRHRRQPGRNDNEREDVSGPRHYCDVLRGTGRKRKAKG